MDGNPLKSDFQQLISNWWKEMCITSNSFIRIYLKTFRMNKIWILNDVRLNSNLIQMSLLFDAFELLLNEQQLECLWSERIEQK